MTKNEHDPETCEDIRHIRMYMGALDRSLTPIEAQGRPVTVRYAEDYEDGDPTTDGTKWFGALCMPVPGYMANVISRTTFSTTLVDIPKAERDAIPDDHLKAVAEDAVYRAVAGMVAELFKDYGARVQSPPFSLDEEAARFQENGRDASIYFLERLLWHWEQDQ